MNIPDYGEQRPKDSFNIQRGEQKFSIIDNEYKTYSIHSIHSFNIIISFFFFIWYFEMIQVASLIMDFATPSFNV